MLLPKTPQEASEAFRKRRFPYDDDQTFATSRRVYETLEDALRRGGFAIQECRDLFPQYLAALNDPDKRIMDSRDIVFALMNHTVSTCQTNLVGQTAVIAYKVAHDKATMEDFSTVLVYGAQHIAMLFTQTRFALRGMGADYDPTSQEHQRMAETAQFLATMADLCAEQMDILGTGTEVALDPATPT